MVAQDRQRGDLGDGAPVDDSDPTRDGARHGQRVGRDDDRRAARPLHDPDLLQHAGPRLVVEARGRLVEQQRRRATDDRPGHCRRGLLPGRQLPRESSQQLVEAEAQRLTPGATAPLLAVLAAQDERHAEVPLDVPGRLQRGALRDHPEPAFVGRSIGDVAATDPHAARRCLLVPGDHAQQRALAGPGPTQQRHDLAVTDPQVDVLDDGGPTSDHRDVAQFDRSHADECGRPGAPGPGLPSVATQQRTTAHARHTRDARDRRRQRHG